jgi:hypothetical protein
MTELSYAYGPLSGPSESLFDSVEHEPKIEAPPKAVVQSTKTPTMPQQQIYDAKTINDQYGQEQKLMTILNEIKKQQKTNNGSQQQESQSYIDKLYSKRKDLWKALQISFIILFAISLHFVIDHYLKLYINNTDLSFERELFIRLLYPIAILFLLWNLKTFIK